MVMLYVLLPSVIKRSGKKIENVEIEWANGESFIRCTNNITIRKVF